MVEKLWRSGGAAAEEMWKRCGQVVETPRNAFVNSCGEVVEKWRSGGNAVEKLRRIGGGAVGKVWESCGNATERICEQWLRSGGEVVGTWWRSYGEAVER